MRKIVALSTVAGAVALPTAVLAPPLEAADHASAPTEELPYCSTYVLTPEQLAAGVTSRVDCYATLEESRVAVGLSPQEPTEAELRAMRAAANGTAPMSAGTGAVTASVNYDWARHYDGIGGGATFAISGPATCDGSGVSFAAGDPWNDRISSTRHFLCGKVKHWADAGFAGNLDLTTGQSNQLVALGSLLNNQVSSMRYFPS